MLTPLVDIGVNLTDRAFETDLNTVIQAANDHQVKALIITGTNLEESNTAIGLCEQYDNTYCTVGVHPHHAKQWSPEHTDQLLQLTQHPKAVAVGETGLDFNRNFSTPEQQEFAFQQQLILAEKTGLPLFLHEREAHERQLHFLTLYRDRIAGGVAHCFTGNADELKQYLALDLYIGITGWICDERRGLHLQDIVGSIPLNRLLLETDAPYLLPRSLRPKPKSRRNEPKFLPHINQEVAKILGIPEDELAKATTENAERLFGISV